MPDSSAIVSKVWNYGHVLENAGGGYGDYVEVRAARAFITDLLFLKPGVKLMRFGFRPISGCDTPEGSGGFF